MLDVNNLILIGYSASWFLLLRNNSKKGRFTLSYSIIALYAILSVITIYVFNSEYASIYYENDITLFPLVYLFAMILLSLLPLITVREKRIKSISIPSNKYLSAFTWFFIISAIYGIIQILPDVQSGLFVMLSDSDTITELYETSTELRKERMNTSATFSFLGIFSSQARAFIPFLLFINLVNPYRKKIQTLMLLIALLQAPLSGIAHASRLELISSVLMIVLLFFFFRPFLATPVKKIMIKIGFVMGVVIATFFIIITVARVSTAGKTSTIFNFARYLGGSTLVFDQYCLNANGTREGHIVAPLVLKVIGEKTLTENEIRDKYSMMRIDNSRFSTFVGDIVLDCGPYLAAILIILFSVFCSSYLKNDGHLSFGQVIMVYLVLRFVSGFYQYQYTFTAGNITFVLMLLFAFCFNKLSSIKISRLTK